MSRRRRTKALGREKSRVQVFDTVSNSAPRYSVERRPGSRCLTLWQPIFQSDRSRDVQGPGVVVSSCSYSNGRLNRSNLKRPLLDPGRLSTDRFEKLVAIASNTWTLDVSRPSIWARCLTLCQTPGPWTSLDRALSYAAGGSLVARRLTCSPPAYL